MKKPNKEDYYFETIDKRTEKRTKDFLCNAFIDDMERYCDELEKALDKATEIICKRCGCYDCEMGCSMPSIDKAYACDLERIKR